VRREVAGQDAAEVLLAEDEHMIPNACPHTVPRRLAVDLIAVAKEIGRCGVDRDGVDELLSKPVGGGALGGVEADGTPAIVRERAEDEEIAEASALPAEDSGQGHDHEGLPPPGPGSAGADPEETI